MASQFNLKPENWPVDRSQVSSEWDWFYDKLAFAYASLDGRVVDLLTGEEPGSATIGNSVPIVTPYGPGIDHSGRLQFDSPYRPLVPDNNHVTICSFYKQPDSIQSLITQRVGFNDNHIEIRARSSKTGTSQVGGLGFFYTFSSGDIGGADIGTGVIADGDDAIVHAVANGGSDLKVYVEGVDRTNTTDNVTGSIVPSTSTFVLGGLPGTTTVNFTGDKYLDVGWNKALTSQQIAQHAADPFGPFTPELSLPAWFITGGSTNLVIQSASQAQSTGNVVLTQDHQLAIQDSEQSQATENLTLNQQNVIAADDSVQAQSAENVSLTVDSQLEIQGAAQAQITDNVTLSQVGVLAVQGSTQSQSTENVNLDQGHLLAIDSLTQQQRAQNMSFGILAVGPLDGTIVVAPAIDGTIVVVPAIDGSIQIKPQIDGNILVH